jgi:Fe-S-cluster-containing dehydrogenase component
MTSRKKPLIPAETAPEAEADMAAAPVRRRAAAKRATPAQSATANDAAGRSPAPAAPAPAVPDPVPAAPAVPDPAPAAHAPAPAIPDTAIPLGELASAIIDAAMSRRRFLGFGLAIAAGVAGGAVLGSLVPLFAEPPGPAPLVPVYNPDTVAWTFVIDTSRCIGCGMCVAACKEENHIPEEPEYNRTWIERHAVATTGEVFTDSPDGGINGFPERSTASGVEHHAVDRSYFVPRLCMQCEDSPCTLVCPVGATYHTPEGIILVDAARCIGCGYCVTACPYGTRYLVPSGPDMPGSAAGVADKCTWCLHRITRGLKPACVEVCPVGARRFGNRADPADPIVPLLAEQHTAPLWPGFGTRPRTLYIGPVLAERDPST